MTSMSSPFKDPKTGIYKLRRRVPENLRPVLGKKEVWKTLGTKDLREAKRLFPDALAECETLFESALAKLECRSQRLTEKEILGLAGFWLKAKLASETASSSDGELETWGNDFTDDIEIRKWDLWVPTAADILRHHKLSVLPESDSFDDLCEALAWAEVKYWHIASKRFAGDWEDKEVNKYPKFERNERTLVILSKLAERKIKEEGTLGRRKEDFQRAVGRFKTLHGDIPVSQITPQHVVEQKDQFVEMGLAAATTNKRLSDLSSILSYAKKNHIIASNPAIEIRVGGAKTSVIPRESYSKADLKKLFSGPVHKMGKRPEAGQGEAAYWLPLISLYSGARLAEIGQLNVSDIKKTKDGIACLDINRIGEKVVKNNNSIRRVPIHHELITRGFLDYVSAQSDRMFPGVEWAMNMNGERSQFGKAWGQWFGRYKKNQGITGKKDFHSFRHTFIDNCREVGIDSELRMKITGHAPQSVGSGYGTSDLLETLKNEIDKVKYKLK